MGITLIEESASGAKASIPATFVNYEAILLPVDLHGPPTLVELGLCRKALLSSRPYSPKLQSEYQKQTPPIRRGLFFGLSSTNQLTLPIIVSTLYHTAHQQQSCYQHGISFRFGNGRHLCQSKGGGVSCAGIETGFRLKVASATPPAAKFPGKLKITGTT